MSLPPGIGGGGGVIDTDVAALERMLTVDSCFSNRHFVTLSNMERS